MSSEVPFKAGVPPSATGLLETETDNRGRTERTAISFIMMTLRSGKVLY